MSGLHTIGRFIEGSGLLGYDDVLLCEWLLLFQREHHCLTLKMKAKCFFGMSGATHPTTQHHIPEALSS